MISLVCPACGTKAVVPDTAAGKKGKCRQCGQLVQVPASPPVTVAVPPRPAHAPIQAPPTAAMPTTSTAVAPAASPTTIRTPDPRRTLKLIGYSLAGAAILLAPVIYYSWRQYQSAADAADRVYERQADVDSKAADYWHRAAQE